LYISGGFCKRSVDEYARFHRLTDSTVLFSRL
jgi:hypothetical protein